MHLEEEKDSIQRNVHNMVQNIGGYWQPLSVVARILEEVGELAVEIDQPSPDVNKIALEMADLLVATTCLANQYYLDLDSIYREFAIPENLQLPSIPDISLFHLLAKICNGAGSIARIVNYYEGDKPPKSNETISSLAPAIGRLYYVLAELAGYLSVNGLDKVKEVTTRNIKRDATRFSPKYDPLTALSVVHFQHFQKGADQELRGLQRLWGGPQWQKDRTLENNMQSQVHPFARFCKVSLYEPIQAFVIELRVSSQGKVRDAVFAMINKALSFLNINSQIEENQTFPHLIQFAGRLLQIFVFVPHWNTRLSCDEEDQDMVFLLFVPVLHEKVRTI